MNQEINESPERAAYRKKCKHYSPFSGQCYKHSRSNDVYHINIRCDGNCERMKHYDKIHKDEQGN